MAAYFGIVSRVSDSKDTFLIKNGSKIGRTTLIQSTLAAMRHSPYLSKYYERIKRHRGSGKAITATTRKFLGITYKTLRHDWIF